MIVIAMQTQGLELQEAVDFVGHMCKCSIDRFCAAKKRLPSFAHSDGVAGQLRELFFQLPGGNGNEVSREMDSVERIRAGPTSGGKSPEEMSPQELHAVLWQVLAFRDSGELFL